MHFVRHSARDHRRASAHLACRWPRTYLTKPSQAIRRPTPTTLTALPSRQTNQGRRSSAPPEIGAVRTGQRVDWIVIEPVPVAAVMTCVDAWSRVTLTWMVPTVAVAFTA